MDFLLLKSQRGQQVFKKEGWILPHTGEKTEKGEYKCQNCEK
jgi:hypothetical protein